MTDHLDSEKRSRNTSRIRGKDTPLENEKYGRCPSIYANSKVEKRIKSTPPFLELDGKDAKGLVGTDRE